MEPGLYPGMSREQYDEVEALNQSTIKVAYERSLYHARMKQLEVKTPSDALIEGNALHTLILEPELFDKRYGPMPVTEKNAKHSIRTKAGLTAWEQYEDTHAGKHPIKATRIEELRAIRDQVLTHPLTSELIANAIHKETSFFWEHPDYGFLCKGQFDLLTEYNGWTWIIDLKSAADASKEGFRRAVASYGYMVQDAFYTDGLNEIAPADRRFGFVAFEKEFPYAIQIHELDPELRFEGRFRIDTVCKQWAEAQETGIYPGYPPGINVLTGPRWAMTHERVMEEENE
jgi:ATP-dependent exoDNAse (exonuclease V) beta subunit